MDIENRVVTIKQLLLDPNNLRLDVALTEDAIPEEDYLLHQNETLERLEYENIDELRESILNNGFIEVDRIVVKEVDTISSTQKLYIVIEGNRRTAALKGLYNDYLAGTIDIDDELKSQFSNINVCCITTKDPDKITTLSASLMGIRHVSGPKKWQGVQSAKLVYKLCKQSRTFTEIASLLGISSSDAERRYEGYLAFLQMKECRPARTLTKHYALLLEFLSNKVSRAWLDWNGQAFSNEETYEVLLDHLLPTKGKIRAEINNPADARTFNRHLEIPEHSALLKSREATLSSLPDLPRSNKSKLAHINRFISFINNIPNDDLDSALEETLEELISSINSKISNEDDR
ncbi:ParB/RepB/Spo0J family partition protein [Vibrio sp. RM-44-3]|uniref:ParB/RepB/Spo0J family partition protein n=1 Tax=unclassified Vibrio TaxID=2614977 RepID=UPI00215C9483|nr:MULTISPECIES: ParB/RepB/Spo0J family partition protein [unclassified Vibrio]MCR9552737.1 ParB/RepB/Spo0J family partition protein [Vibrio sp. RM-41-2A]MCR9557193.1 ParB/RepB/Spo0J family partition protein [Vibrio sp. RM-41-2B]MCR9621236.1 ParB/RepB/Spo0J family partition protein [Vibrio sp. RM-44-3]